MSSTETALGAIVVAAYKSVATSLQALQRVLNVSRQLNIDYCITPK
jgi:hypothetical protein